MSKPTKAERTHRFFNRMSELGFSFEEANALRRIEMILHRWFEMECGIDNPMGGTTAIERDETSDKPFLRVMFQPRVGPYVDRSTPCADREKGARKRLAAIMERHPGLWAYVQTDPRGCALYIGRKDDMANGAGFNPESLHSAYNRGVAVCID